MQMQKLFPELVENHFHIYIAGDDDSALHGHDYLEFSYITSGSMEHWIDEQRSVLNVGDYYIVDHGTVHSYRRISQEPLEVVNFLFYPEFLDRTLAGCRRFADILNSYLLRFSDKTLRTTPTGKTFHDEDGQLRNLVSALIREYMEKKQGYNEYARCLFVEMLILTLRNISSDRQQLRKSDIILAISDYIKKNYASHIRLSELAKKHNYSVSYLSKKFYQEMGVGFSDYLQHIRIEQSCRLLENRSLRICEVATAVGYENLKFFNQVFRHTLGMTPREFRRTRSL